MAAVVVSGVVAVFAAVQLTGFSDTPSSARVADAAETPPAPQPTAPTSRPGAPTDKPKGAAPASTSASPTPSPSRTSASPQPSRTRSTGGSGAGTGAAEQQVLAQINAARADAGAGPLTMASGLIASAHAHNLVMAGGCGLAHECSGESGLGDRISAQGVNWTLVAENIGDGGPVGSGESDQAAMAIRLTASMLAETPPDDGHRKNILNPGLSRIGIDVYRDRDGTVWMTQDFAS